MPYVANRKFHVAWPGPDGGTSMDYASGDSIADFLNWPENLRSIHLEQGYVRQVEVAPVQVFSQEDVDGLLAMLSQWRTAQQAALGETPKRKAKEAKA